MAKVAKAVARGPNPWRVLAWGAAACLLLLPLIAMQFTQEVHWTTSDFLFAGVMFGAVGGAFELVVRASRSRAYRGGAALALLAAFLTVWVNGAVGMIEAEDNPYNLLFGGVLLVALIGAILARFQPAGSARAMILAGIAHAAVSAGGFAADPRGALFSLAFTVPWLLAAALFDRAARRSD